MSTFQPKQSELGIVNGVPLPEMPEDLFIPPQALEICLETFTGPMDLLLYLIKKQNINKITKSQVFITHELENRYFFPINDKKIVVAKIGKDFSWFSFVTLFITLYGLILYIYGMINIYNVFNDTVTFYGIVILTAVTFAIGYWWFVNNTGEKRLREVYDN